MLRDDAKLEAVECFTTTDRAHKYTVIVLKKRIRYTAIERTMAILLVRHGIIRKALVGGESITSDDKLDKEKSLVENVAFKWILKDLKEHGPHIEEYVAEGRKSIIKAFLTGKNTFSEAMLADEVMEEYDVVKKQRTIQMANDFVGFDISSALLGSEEAANYFRSFSTEVWSAIQRLCIREQELRIEDEADMATNQSTETIKRVGYVYGVGNPCLGTNMHKIGATFRDSPWPRVKELSKCLPANFHIISLVACTNPFEIEKKAHSHFADKRVLKEATGRRTEFFLVSEEELSSYFAQLNQDLVSSN
jgi:hypothetical protein